MGLKDFVAIRSSAVRQEWTHRLLARNFPVTLRTFHLKVDEYADNFTLSFRNFQISAWYFLACLFKFDLELTARFTLIPHTRHSCNHPLLSSSVRCGLKMHSAGVFFNSVFADISRYENSGLRLRGKMETWLTESSGDTDDTFVATSSHMFPAWFLVSSAHEWPSTWQ